MNIQQYLPSKKIKIVLLTLIILGIGYLGFVLFRKTASVKEKNFIDVALVEDARSGEYYKDTDGDGAYDWEEALWPELDPENPDSDGDGVLDGKYIKTKQAIQEKERRGVDLPESNLTETEKLGRSSYTALLAIAQSAGSIDGETEQQISDNIALYIQDLTLGDKVYTRDQLNLITDSKENIDIYEKRMIRLFEEYPVSASDIELLLNSSENIEGYRNELEIALVKYSSYLEELILAEIPFSIAGRHTELINNISQINGAIDNLLLEEPDELVSLALLVQLEKIMSQTVEAIVNINLFFEIVKDENLFKS